MKKIMMIMLDFAIFVASILVSIDLYVYDRLVKFAEKRA